MSINLVNIDDSPFCPDKLEPRQLNQRETLFGFVAWLTTRPGELKIGAECDCAGLTELIEEFSNANGFEPVGDQWPNNLIHPMPEVFNEAAEVSQEAFDSLQPGHYKERLCPDGLDSAEVCDG